jgi:hypothetical protein
MCQKGSLEPLSAVSQTSLLLHLQHTSPSSRKQEFRLICQASHESPEEQAKRESTHVP